MVFEWKKKTKNFSDDKKIVGKVLKGLELADRKDDKLTLIKLRFLMNGYKKCSTFLARRKIFSPNL